MNLISYMNVYEFIHEYLIRQYNSCLVFALFRLIHGSRFYHSLLSWGNSGRLPLSNLRRAPE